MEHVSGLLLVILRRARLDCVRACGLHVNHKLVAKLHLKKLEKTLLGLELVVHFRSHFSPVDRLFLVCDQRDQPGLLLSRENRTRFVFFVCLGSAILFSALP